MTPLPQHIVSPQSWSPQAQTFPPLAFCCQVFCHSNTKVLAQTQELDKVRNVQRQKNYVGRDGNSEHPKEILEMKITVIEMKSTHGWLIIRLETAEERISEL